MVFLWHLQQLYERQPQPCRGIMLPMVSPGWGLLQGCRLNVRCWAAPEHTWATPLTDTPG